MKPLLLILNLLCAADASETHIALAHGAHEVVVPSQNPYVVDTAIAGEAVTMTWALGRIAKTHPTRAKVLAWAFIGVRGTVVAMNARQLHQQLAR